eukprot:352312-Chlamydomonas_euryale.AAC.15
MCGQLVTCLRVGAVLCTALAVVVCGALRRRFARPVLACLPALPIEPSCMGAHVGGQKNALGCALHA